MNKPPVILYKSDGLPVGMLEEFLTLPISNLPDGAISVRREIEHGAIAKIEVNFANGVTKQFATSLTPDRKILLGYAFKITRTENL